MSVKVTYLWGTLLSLTSIIIHVTFSVSTADDLKLSTKRELAQIVKQCTHFIKKTIWGRGGGGGNAQTKIKILIGNIEWKQWKPVGMVCCNY